MKDIIRPLEWAGNVARTPFGDDYHTGERECSQCPVDYGQLYFAGKLVEERHGAEEVELRALATEHYLALAASILQPDAMTTLAAFTVAECRVAAQASLMHHAAHDKARGIACKALNALVPATIVQAWRAQRAHIRAQALEAAKDAIYFVARAPGGWLVGKNVYTDPRDAVRAAIDIMHSK